MALKDILSSNGYYSLNKMMLKELGLITAVYLTNLIDKYAYLQSKGTLVWDEDTKKHYIYASVPNIEKHTTLSRRQQDTARSLLESMGLIEIVRKGVPATYHFWINEKAVWRMLQSRVYENATLECTNPPNKSGGNVQTISKNTSKTQNKNNISKNNSENLPDLTDIDSVFLFLDGGGTIPTAKLTTEQRDFLLGSGYSESNGNISLLPF